MYVGSHQLACFCTLFDKGRDKAPPLLGQRVAFHQGGASWFLNLFSVFRSQNIFQAELYNIISTQSNKFVIEEFCNMTSMGSIA